MYLCMFSETSSLHTSSTANNLHIDQNNKTTTAEQHSKTPLGNPHSKTPLGNPHSKTPLDDTHSKTPLDDTHSKLPDDQLDEQHCKTYHDEKHSKTLSDSQQHNKTLSDSQQQNNTLSDSQHAEQQSRIPPKSVSNSAKSRSKTKKGRQPAKRTSKKVSDIKSSQDDSVTTDQTSSIETEQDVSVAQHVTADTVYSLCDEFAEEVNTDTVGGGNQQKDSDYLSQTSSNNSVGQKKIEKKSGRKQRKSNNFNKSVLKNDSSLIVSPVTRLSEPGTIPGDEMLSSPADLVNHTESSDPQISNDSVEFEPKVSKSTRKPSLSNKTINNQMEEVPIHESSVITQVKPSDPINQQSTTQNIQDNNKKHGSVSNQVQTEETTIPDPQTSVILDSNKETKRGRPSRDRKKSLPKRKTVPSTSSSRKSSQPQQLDATEDLSKIEKSIVTTSCEHEAESHTGSVHADSVINSSVTHNRTQTTEGNSKLKKVSAKKSSAKQVTKKTRKSKNKEIENELQVSMAIEAGLKAMETTLNQSEGKSKPTKSDRKRKSSNNVKADAVPLKVKIVDNNVAENPLQKSKSYQSLPTQNGNKTAGVSCLDDMTGVFGKSHMTFNAGGEVTGSLTKCEEPSEDVYSILNTFQRTRKR